MILLKRRDVRCMARRSSPISLRMAFALVPQSRATPIWPISRAKPSPRNLIRSTPTQIALRALRTMSSARPGSLQRFRQRATFHVRCSLGHYAQASVASRVGHCSCPSRSKVCLARAICARIANRQRKCAPKSRTLSYWIGCLLGCATQRRSQKNGETSANTTNRCSRRCSARRLLVHLAILQQHRRRRARVDACDRAWLAGVARRRRLAGLIC